MPIIKRAIKKLHHDRVRSKENELVRMKVHTVVKAARKTKTPKTIALAYQTLDKAVKHGVVHPNKAARLKSRLAKLLKKS
ncbi:30S ribosomal protein S20 [Candidatus Gottesmanbacteria bacterium]|nr:30S ribosomal protein S20 [Candidatus Gottesmanbacteria bacterium]